MSTEAATEGFRVLLQLWRQVPEAGTVWPMAKRRLWLRAAEATFAVLFDDGAPATPSGGETKRES